VYLRLFVGRFEEAAAAVHLVGRRLRLRGSEGSG